MPLAVALRHVLDSVLPGRQPLRKYRFFRLHLIGAGFAASVAAVCFLVFYYLTLGLLPVAFDSWSRPHTQFPFTAWEYRLDLSQWLGSFVVPPWPDTLTWWIGLALLGGSLVGAGVGYGLLLSWDLALSSVGKGVGYGILLFLSMGMMMWVADGIQPAVMRSALPDVGFFFLGWTGWAAIQVFIAFVLYGAVLGGVYRAIEKIPIP